MLANTSVNNETVKCSSNTTTVSSILISTSTTSSACNSSLSTDTHCLHPVITSDPIIVNVPNSTLFAAIEKQREIIVMDHCYARPLNWTPESAFFQPTKVLFMTTDELSLIKSRNPLAPQLTDDSDDVIDVESVPADISEQYDKGKALSLMDECDRHAAFARTDDENENWEDTISKTNWTFSQNLLFNGMVKILNSDRLARLAHTSAHHEPILRRIAIDKAVKRVRYLFATISWNPRLTQWLHQLLIDNLSTPYLGAYFDILQTLKSKLPVFVDKMMFGPNANNRVGATSNESLFHLLKRPWDPFAANFVQTRPRKLPGNPIIIIVPSSPSVSNPNQLKRQHKWITLLSNLCTVVAVHTNMGSSANRLTMINCADQMLAATRAKIQEVKSDYPGRPIVLIGFNAGSALALQVAQVEHVLSVVCLGFSLLTAEGKRGEPDDSLLELQCPVLFVIGQCSNTSLQEDIEDLRERMRVENGLIVVGFADDYLRVNKKKKRAEGITQSGIDRSVVDHIGEFISSLLLSPFPPQLRQSPIHGSSEIPPPKRPKIERKRNNSNGSSIDSEPPSPTPKITRPVGRPPGSKGKAKLEAKWAAQVNQGISVSSPDTSSLLQSSLSHSLSKTTSNKTPKNKFNSTDAQLSKINNSADSHSNIPSSTAKMRIRAMGLNRSVLTSGTLAHLLQNGSKGNITVPQSSHTSNSTIKVLENVTLNPSTTAKLISGTNRSFDLAKFSSNSKSGPLMIMPDGKLKSFGNSVKGTGSTPIVLPMTHKKLLTPTHPSHRFTKYITSKKQLIDQKPPVPSIKPTVISSFSTNLPPPTNLTSQDIMDLPIIFADDNQMLTDNSKLHASDVPVSEIVQPHTLQKGVVSNPVGKFVFINKQIPISSTVLPSTIASTTTTTTLKRPTLTVPLRTINPLKYAKIVLSNPVSRGSVIESKPSAPSQTSIMEPKTPSRNSELASPPSNLLSTISTLSPDISVCKVGAQLSTPVATIVDVENAIVSTAIKKPDYQITQIKDKQEPESNADFLTPQKLSTSDCKEESNCEEASNEPP